MISHDLYPQDDPSPPLDRRGRVLRKWHRKVENRQAHKIEPQDTVIVDSGVSGVYVSYLEPQCRTSTP